MTTPRNDTVDRRELHEVLGDVFERGDQNSVASGLAIPKQHVSEMVAGVRPNPFGQVAVITEALRRNGNDQADFPFLSLASRLEFVCYRANDTSVDDERFAAVLNEVSKLVGVRAAAESPASDGGARVTPSERRVIADRVDSLIQQAAAYRDAQRAAADVEDARTSK